MCEPSESPVYSFAEVQVCQAPESILHSNVLPDSLDSNSNVAVLVLDGFVGFDVIVVSGAVVSGIVVSIVQVYSAGVASVLPDVSVART